MSARTAGVVLVSILATAAGAQAQQFEAASLRANTSGAPRAQTEIVPASGRLAFTNIALRELIQTAYGVQLPSLVVNLPEWAMTLRVDVVAKAAQPASVDDLERMLQPLLADRLKLIVERRTQEMDVLALVAVPGAARPKVTPSSAVCDAVGTTNRTARAPAQPPPGRGVCGIHPTEGPGRIRATGIEMQALARLLAPSQRRPVLDRTELVGRYDIDLAYTPEAFSAAVIAQRGGAVPPGVDPAGPSLVTALRDQAGLRLESMKAPVDIVVVTRIEPLDPRFGGLPIPALPIPAETVTFAADHLWQSTIFAALAGLAALALRGHRAHVRYWIWMAASVKFLLPFAALTAIGGALSWRTVEVVPYENPVVLIDSVSQPFTRTDLSIRETAGQPASFSLFPALLGLAAPVWAFGSAAVLLLWTRRWWKVRGIVGHAERIRSGREVATLERLALARGIRPLPMLATSAPLEPGVFGVARPVLLWPRGIGEHLTDEQVDAILAHELCHLQRRDNLAAALHMAVQAVFWFHPMVWWIGSRLVDERERTCDEEVLRLGSEPEVYAESILKTCRFYLESPLVCVAGVTGSDLKKRIEQIMTTDVSTPLPLWRKTVLAAAGAAAFAAPVALGALNPPPQTRQLAAPGTLPAFDEASIRSNPSPGRGGRGGQFQPSRFTTTNITLKTLIKMAYAKPGATAGTATNLLDQEIAGGPDWLDSDKYDVTATTPMATQPTPPEQTRLMLQRLLADRFRLAAHWETRELPVYLLVRIRPDGPLAAGLRPISEEECAKAKPAQPGQPFPPGELPPCGAVMFGPGVLLSRGAPMEWLAQVLTTTPVVTGIDRPVLDRTGLKGNHGFEMKFSPATGSGPANPDRADLFTALQEQLGLRLEASREPIDVLVIDGAQKPEAN